MKRTAIRMPEEKPVSFSPLDLEKALKGLLEVKLPDKEKEAQIKKEGPAHERVSGAFLIWDDVPALR